MRQIQSIVESGTDGIVVNVEAHLSNSLPNIVIVGFASKSIDEAKERIRGAFASSGIKLPRKRITINLAPADIPKEGSYFDLPILVAIMLSSKIINIDSEDTFLVMGEVGLDGQVRPIRGIIGKILTAKKLGIDHFWIPKDNTEQASLVPNIKYYPIDNIKNLHSNLQRGQTIDYKSSSSTTHQIDNHTPVTTIDDVIGQELAKRGMQIAAAGNHNILLNGAPGAGKSMLAKTLPDLMPQLTQQEILEITHLHSLSNKNYEKIITVRPFRSPHHSASPASIIGGGQNPRPGEISLAHNGVLLFDEFPEFNRTVIEALRQPLEDCHITVSRAKDTINFPADFLLVATSNPCPCGYFGTTKECICSPVQILNYQKKMSGPILDRIDMYIDVEEVDNSQLLIKNRINKRITLKNSIQKAREVQARRQHKLNSQLTNKDLAKYAKLDTETKDFLDKASSSMGLSSRAYIRTLRLARTIADLEESSDILLAHIGEALQYRRRNKDILA